MKMTIQSLVLFLPLLLLQGCGGGQSSAKLEVSKAFSMTNPYFGGGLIVYGENTTLNKQFSFALDASLRKTIPLDNGNWTFYVIGWDGDTIGTKKFGGATYCGKKTQTISADTTVSIDVTTGGCADPFQSEVKLLPLKIATCGAFYTYNQTQNAFSGITAATPNNFCQNLPVDLRSPYTHAKIVALEKINNTIIPRFESSCFAIDGYTSYSQFPNNKIPLEIKAYRSIEECQSTTAKFLKFTFPMGIEAGNPKFDQLHFIASDMRLILASSITRRGYSPLMAYTPRVLCGASGAYTDCMPDDTSGVHINVDWFHQNYNLYQKRYSVLKNVGSNSCPVSSTSTKFGIKDCTVDDNQIKVHIYRNEFVCHESTTFQNVVDLYGRNDKLYVLKGVSPSKTLYVYSPTGELLKSLNLAGLAIDALDVAVTVDNTVLISHATGVEQFDSNLNHITSVPIALTTETIQDIEVGEASSVFFIATYDGISTYELRSYNLDGSGLQSKTIFSTGETKKVQFYGGSVYVRQTGASNISKIPLLANGHIDTIPTIQNLPVDSGVSNFHIANNLFYLDYVNKVYDINLTTQQGSVTLGFSTALTSLADKLFSIGSGLTTYDLTNTSPTSNFKEASGVCEEDVTFTSGTSTKTLNLMTKVNSIYPIFADTFNIIGRQFFATEEQASYLYDQHNDEEVKVSGGGLLNDAFKDLSPAGIAGIIPRSIGADCTTILNYVSTNGAYTKTESVYDPFKNETVSAQITIRPISELIHSYLCNPTNPAATCAAGDKYTLQLDYAVNSGEGNDKGRIKIACGTSPGNSGSYERYEVEDDGAYRKLVLWQTTQQDFARFEEYKYEIGINNKFYGEVTRFEKTAQNNFWSRRAGLHSDNSGTSGWSSQIERIGNSLAVKNDNLGEATFADFFSSADPAIRGSVSYQTESTPSCVDLAASPTLDSNYGAACTFTYPDPLTDDILTSKALELKIDSFNDLDDPSPQIRQIFQIP